MPATEPRDQLLRRRLAAPLAGKAGAEHPDPELVVAHAAGELSPEYALALTRHLTLCDDGRCNAVLRDVIAGAAVAREALYPSDRRRDEESDGGLAAPARHPRTFLAADDLWEAFEALARDEARSPDALLEDAMRAYAQETDPVSLEGFAESIRAKYPTATVLLLGRAREIRAAQTAPSATAAPPQPGAIGASSPLAASPPAKPPTYVVQPGDTPTVIAERLAHDGKRWPELVAANPNKPTAPDGSFATLRPGESLSLPASWGAPPMPQAHATALPKDVQP